MARPKKTEEQNKKEKELLDNGLKECYTCKNIKQLNDFPRQYGHSTEHRRHCKECYSKIRKNRYQKNKDKIRKQAKKSYEKHKKKRINKNTEYIKNNPKKHKEWQKKHREKCKKEFEEFKSNLSCSICGFDQHPKAIDLHHINPKEKSNLISKLIYCRKKLKEELTKCIPICANCHRILHSGEEDV